MLTLSIILSFMLNQHYIINISNGSAKTVIKIYVYIGNPRICKTGSIYNYKDTKYLWKYLCFGSGNLQTPNINQVVGLQYVKLEKLLNEGLFLEVKIPL